MENIISNSVLVLIGLVIFYLLIKFWNRRISKKIEIKPDNKSYSIFISSQLISVLLIVISVVDERVASYLEQFNYTGVNSNNSWAVLGIITFTILFTIIIANFITFIVYRFTNISNNEFMDHILNDRWSQTLIFGVLLVSLSFLIANYVGHPFIFEWVSTESVEMVY